MAFNLQRIWTRKDPGPGLPAATPVAARRVAPRAEAGAALYVVGDVHGRADLLEALLRTFEADQARLPAEFRRELIFLGDYVDRGPDARKVIETLLVVSGRPRPWTVTALRGNHEAALLKFLDDASVWPAWSRHGARETLLAYGVAPPAADGDAAEWERARRAFEIMLPPAHREFLEALPLTAVSGDYFFVHAGVRPGVPLERQSEGDLLSIREPFLASHRDFGKVVVHGHTPGPAENCGNRISLDTGAYATGVLTGLRLIGGEQAFLTAAREDQRIAPFPSDG